MGKHSFQARIPSVSSFLFSCSPGGRHRSALAADSQLTLGPLINEAVKQNPFHSSRQGSVEFFEGCHRLTGRNLTRSRTEIWVSTRFLRQSPIAGAVYGFGQEIPFPGKIESSGGKWHHAKLIEFEQEYEATKLANRGSPEGSVFRSAFRASGHRHCGEK